MKITNPHYFQFWPETQFFLDDLNSNVIDMLIQPLDLVADGRLLYPKVDRSRANCSYSQ
jgi:hypothetical protein